mgnify:CR=1 FL=1
MEREADFERRKEAASVDAKQYLAENPQLKQLLNDFVATVLAQRPADIRSFARDYFNRFKSDSQQNPSSASSASTQHGSKP